jgi:hypothetical protein
VGQTLADRAQFAAEFVGLGVLAGEQVEVASFQDVAEQRLALPHLVVDALCRGQAACEREVALVDRG